MASELATRKGTRDTENSAFVPVKVGIGRWTDKEAEGRGNKRSKSNESVGVVLKDTGHGEHHQPVLRQSLFPRKSL